MTKGTIQNQESFLNRIASSLGRERRTGGVAVPEWRISRNIKHLKVIQRMT